jgi:hypothetical protein
MGGVAGALGQSADEAINALGPERREQARKLLMRVVKTGRGVEDVRQTVMRQDALEAAGGEDAEEVLLRLSGGRDPGSLASPASVRLLVVSGEGREARVDLVHESLLTQWKMLRDWIGECRAELERRDDLETAAEVWMAAGSSEENLPTGTALAYFQESRGHGELAERFLRRAERRELARRRLFAAGYVGLCVLLPIGGTMAQRLWDDAAYARTLATLVLNRDDMNMARRHLEQSLATAEALAKANSQDVARQTDLARAHALAALAAAGCHDNEAVIMHRKAGLEILDRLKREQQIVDDEQMARVRAALMEIDVSFGLPRPPEPF